MKTFFMWDTLIALFTLMIYAADLKSLNFELKTLDSGRNFKRRFTKLISKHFFRMTDTLTTFYTL